LRASGTSWVVINASRKTAAPNHWSRCLAIIGREHTARTCLSRQPSGVRQASGFNRQIGPVADETGDTPFGERLKILRPIDDPGMDGDFGAPRRTHVRARQHLASSKAKRDLQ